MLNKCQLLSVLYFIFLSVCFFSVPPPRSQGYRKYRKTKMLATIKTQLLVYWFVMLNQSNTLFHFYCNLIEQSYAHVLNLSNLRMRWTRGRKQPWREKMGTGTGCCERPIISSLDGPVPVFTSVHVLTNHWETSFSVPLPID